MRYATGVRLADVFVRARLEAANAIAHLGLRRKKHDRRCRCALQLRQELQAIPIRKHDVEDDERELVITDGSARLRSRRAERRREARAFERVLQVHADREAVVDDEHSGHVRSPARASRVSVRATSWIGKTSCVAQSSMASCGMPKTTDVASSCASVIPPA